MIQKTRKKLTLLLMSLFRFDAKRRVEKCKVEIRRFLICLIFYLSSLSDLFGPLILFSFIPTA